MDFMIIKILLKLKISYSIKMLRQKNNSCVKSNLSFLFDDLQFSTQFRNVLVQMCTEAQDVFVSITEALVDAVHDVAY